MSYDDWHYPEYISVSQKKINNENLAKKLVLKNKILKPVVLEGRKISKTFWGKAWCDNVESYQDYENRLPRGRTYVRCGAVLDLQIAPGTITALVAGSSSKPYKINIEIAQLEKERWETLKQKCVGQVTSLLDLAQGKLPVDILKEFCMKDSGLFPSSKEIKTNCTCLDWADMCKHLAAVLYGVGARLDEDPSLFFVLRGIDENELVGRDIINALTEGIAAEISVDALSSVFGMEFDSLDDNTPGKAGKKRKAPALSSKMSREEVQESIPGSFQELTPEGIFSLRNQLKLSQSKFAQMIGVNAVTISNWERGKTSPRVSQRRKLDKVIYKIRRDSGKKKK